MESGARVRYEQDLAEFIPIAHGARLIQERSGLSEDEAREAIVAALRDDALEVRYWSISRGERSRYHPDNRLHNFLDNLTSDLIDWEHSIARKWQRGINVLFEVEIEVSRADVCRLCLALGGVDERQADRPALKQDEGRPLDKQPSSVDRSSLKAEHASTRKSWTQDRTDYWINRATDIRNESPHFSLLQIARKIKKEDAPDHLPDDQKEVWKKKGWTTENIHRRLKGQL